MESLFGIIQERVYGRGQRNPYHQGREETTSFDHQRASHYRLVRTEMETAYQSQPLATTVIAFFFHRQEEKQEKTLTYPHKCLPLQANKCKLRILSNSVLIDYGNASKS